MGSHEFRQLMHHPELLMWGKNQQTNYINKCHSSYNYSNYFEQFSAPLNHSLYPLNNLEVCYAGTLRIKSVWSHTMHGYFCLKGHSGITTSLHSSPQHLSSSSLGQCCLDTTLHKWIWETYTLGTVSVKKWKHSYRNTGAVISVFSYSAENEMSMDSLYWV